MSDKAGGYTRQGRKKREKRMKEASTWVKKKGMKMGEGLYRK